MVEAEHLLLAATRLDIPAAEGLRTAGLDYDGLLDALDAETARSLAAVGVHGRRAPVQPVRPGPEVRGLREAGARTLAQGLARPQGQLHRG